MLQPHCPVGTAARGQEYAKDHIHYAFDGVVFQTVETHKSGQPSHQPPEFFDVPYYMILNTAVGGPWPVILGLCGVGI